MAARDPEEEFEFLVNLLASDEVESDSAPAGSQTGTSGLAGIQRGPDGKLDLGQVKAFYERKSGCSRDRSGLWADFNPRGGLTICPNVY